MLYDSCGRRSSSEERDWSCRILGGVAFAFFSPSFLGEKGLYLLVVVMVLLLVALPLSFFQLPLLKMSLLLSLLLLLADNCKCCHIVFVVGAVEITVVFLFSFPC